MELNFGETTQIILLLGSYVGLIYSIWWTYKRIDMWFIGIPVVLMLLHSSIYYTVIIISLFNGINLLNFVGVNNFPAVWSAVLRLHFVVTTVACLYMVDTVFDVIAVKKFSTREVKSQCPNPQHTQSG